MDVRSLLKDPSLLQTDSFVDGQWVAAKSGKRFDVTNPATNEKIASCPEFDDNDTISAIEVAKKAFVQFRETTPRQRADLLLKWAELMKTHVEDLAILMTVDNGKPLADARGEIAYAANFFDWFAAEALRSYGDTITPSNPRHRLITIKQPVGVCGLITPWNFPAAMITRKAGPAIAAGCTVVAKAAGETPLTALALAELGRRAGIPAGVFNVVTTLQNTAQVGETLTTHPVVKKISFTGSTAVGKLLMRQSSSTLKKMSMELGGNAPFVVFADADLDAAVDGLIASKFRIAGQTCVCANRVLVHETVRDVFVEKLVDRVRQFRFGNGLHEQTVNQGPLIHHRAVDKVAANVEDAVSHGARVVFGGNRLDHLGPNFFNATILVDMKPGMRICSEETFGPVAAVFSFSTEEEAIELANNTDVGLGGYFYSRDIDRCWRVAEALEVGMVGVNTGVISDPVAPFGCIKQSGFGREGSKYGLDEFLVMKTVMFGGE